MATKYTLDPRHPHYQEGRRMALELKHDHILAEAKVRIFLNNYHSFLLQYIDGWQIKLKNGYYSMVGQCINPLLQR